MTKEINRMTGLQNRFKTKNVAYTYQPHFERWVASGTRTHNLLGHNQMLYH